MRTLFAFLMVTLDGFFDGPAPWALDWHNVDGEFNDFAIRQLDEVDMLLFGRRTFQGMAGYWPTETAKANDPVVAEKMNSLPKLVFSATLDGVEWNNSRLVKENAAEVVSRLKRQHGRDMAVFGSSALAASLLRLGLLDEVRLMVNPVVLGSGRRVFEGLNDKRRMELLRTRTFRSGNVLLCYRPLQ